MTYATMTSSFNLDLDLIMSSSTIRLFPGSLFLDLVHLFQRIGKGHFPNEIYSRASVSFFCYSSRFLDTAPSIWPTRCYRTISTLTMSLSLESPTMVV